MVVGDHDVEPTPGRLGNLVDGGDTAIDRQHESDAVVRESREGLARDAVALLEATRKVPYDVGAELTEEENGERRRADPVDVVVAVHADARAARDGRTDALDRDLHVAEKERIVSGKRGVEKTRCDLWRVVATACENGRRDVADAEIARERAGCAGVDGCDRPRTRHAR